MKINNGNSPMCIYLKADDRIWKWKQNDEEQ